MSESNIIIKIRDYNYGFLNSANKPSLLNRDKANLNQNATQSYCLILNLPFIFYNHIDELSEIWPIMESLLCILQIVFSETIRESDLSILSTKIEFLLSSFMNTFKISLTPKAHILTHYPTIIRATGPLKNTWMMRFEAKHKVFTRLSKLTNNFKDICATLAERHQQIQFNKLCLKNTIKLSKQTLIIKNPNFEKYHSFFQSVSMDVTKMQTLKFFKFNCFEFREGLMLINDYNIYEIIYIIHTNEKILLFCSSYNKIAFNKKLNSIQIEKYSETRDTCSLIKFDDIINFQTYDKIINNKIFIIADTLKVHSNLE